MKKMQKLRAELFNTIYGADTLEGILKVFRADYNLIKNIEGTNTEMYKTSTKLFQRYLLAITYMYSISSIKNNLKKFKAVIKEESGELGEIAQRVFFIGGGKDGTIPSIHKIVFNKTEEKIKERESKPQRKKINIESEISRVKTILKKSDYRPSNNQTEQGVRSYYLAYLLGLSGGRRFAEIIKTSHIVKKGESYIFRGILKKEKNDPTIIEVNLIGLTISEYRAYQKELRAIIDSELQATKGKTLEEVSINEINTFFSKKFNNAVLRISDKIIPNFHDLRHLYSIEGTELFKRVKEDGETESNQEVRYRILGHKPKSDSTRTYATSKS